MKYQFCELVDLGKIRSLIQSFYELTKIPATITDLNGNILQTEDGRMLGVGWKKICLDFHRINPETEEFCKESDITLSAIRCGERPFYQCLNGMTDAAIPIVIDGEHLVNLFTGQFFFEPPDREFFRQRAQRFGFNEDAYLQALDDVPVLSRAYVETGMTFLEMLAGVIAEMGLKQKRLLVELEKSKAAAEAAQRAEAEAMRAQRAAEIANQSRTRFFAAASHDLRQPIHALRLFIEVLLPHLQNTPHAAKINGAAQALTSAEAILHSLFDVARMQAGAVTPCPRDIDLPELFDSLKTQFRPQTAAKGLSFRLRPGLCRTVRSDPLMLERILRNLLTNAVRYTDHGGIVLGCRRRGAATLFEIWDSGCGIAEHDLERIWEEFFQVGNDAQDKNPGLGLGLSIAHKLAQCLGHRLEAHSRLGKGTLFRLTIPDPVLDL